MMKSDDLKNKVALITGASSGIGAAAAKTLADHGATVILADLRLEQVTEVAGQIRANGGNAAAEYVDVSDPDKINSMMEHIFTQFDHIDILVNNAGIVDRTPIEELTPERYHKVMDTNLTSGFNLIQAVFPGMKKAGGGKIVNISSLAGHTGGALDSPAYHVSKGGVNSLTMAYACQLGKYNINVNAIAPGLIATPMREGSENPKELRRIPLKRYGTAQDIANCIYFLVSDLSSYITGVTLDVNGGIWIH